MKTEQLQKYVEEVFRHWIKTSEPMINCRAPWPDGPTLDIFYPDLKLAIEVKGPECYVLMGNRDKFFADKRRALRKKKRCEENGVLLIEFNYLDHSSFQEKFKIELDIYLKSYGVTCSFTLPVSLFANIREHCVWLDLLALDYWSAFRKYRSYAEVGGIVRRFYESSPHKVPKGVKKWYLDIAESRDRSKRRFAQKTNKSKKHQKWINRRNERVRKDLYFE